MIINLVLQARLCPAMRSYNCLEDSIASSYPLLMNLLERKTKKSKISYLKQSLPANMLTCCNERHPLFKQVSEIKWEAAVAKLEKTNSTLCRHWGTLTRNPCWELDRIEERETLVGWVVWFSPGRRKGGPGNPKYSHLYKPQTMSVWHLHLKVWSLGTKTVCLL